MNRIFLVDLVERTISTYAQAFLGLLLADQGGLLSLGALHAAGVAALPAALAVVKGALAGSLGTDGTASLIAAPAITNTTAAPAPVAAVPSTEDIVADTAAAVTAPAAAPAPGGGE